MKKLKATILCMVLLLLTCVANAATLTVEIDKLEFIAPDNVWNYQLNFDIIGENTGINVLFNETSQHLWVINEDTKVPNWDLSGFVNQNTNQFVILSINNGNKLKSPLVNGELFQIEYGSGTELDLVFYSFLSEDTIDDPIPLITSFDAASNTITLSAVPIPSSLLLLGCGIFAIAGISRRKK